MNVKLLMTEFGTILCDIVAYDMDGLAIEIENPLLLTPTGDNRFQISPLMFGTSEKRIVLLKSRLVAQNPIQPELTLLNKYNELFGAGIILAGANDILT